MRGILFSLLFYLSVGMISNGATEATAGNPVRFDLSRAPIKVGSRVIGIKLEVAAATIDSVSPVPGGWTFEITNDINGVASLKGDYLVGAAALSLDEVSQIIRLKVLDEKTLRINAVLTLIGPPPGAVEYELPLKPGQFRLAPVTNNAANK